MYKPTKKDCFGGCKFCEYVDVCELDDDDNEEV